MVLAAFDEWVALKQFALASQWHTIKQLFNSVTRRCIEGLSNDRTEDAKKCGKGVVKYGDEHEYGRDWRADEATRIWGRRSGIAVQCMVEEKGR